MEQKLVAMYVIWEAAEVIYHLGAISYFRSESLQSTSLNNENISRPTSTTTGFNIVRDKRSEKLFYQMPKLKYIDLIKISVGKYAVGSVEEKTSQ